MILKAYRSARLPLDRIQLLLFDVVCFYLELSYEFLLGKVLLGEGLKDKNRDPSGLRLKD